MPGKYDVTYYTDFLINLKREFNSSNDVCDVFNIGIKQYIDEICNSDYLSASSLQKIKNVIFSNTQDAKHLAIYLIENMFCPIEMVREIADKTTDSDILLACLSVECDKKRIPYLVNSINQDKLKSIAIRAEIDNKPPEFTAVALNYLAKIRLWH